MKITILSPQRRKPQIGDRRTTKKHGLQIRVVQVHDGMWVKSGSRYCYEWRKPESLVGTFWEYILTPQDWADIRYIEHARRHAQDIERTLFF